MKNIALLGFGTVGSGVAELMEMNYEHIKENIGEEINIKYILDLRDFSSHKLASKFTKNFDDILNDKDVSIVAEMIGGSHPAFEFTSAALKAGKSVVTSNKEVVANFGVELLKIAKENQVSYLFEASVGGGIPIIRPMTNSLAGDKINAIDGILNGTTNYILTQMFDNGLDFDTALSQAQKLGYAEANPAADIEGTDVCRKICILAALASGNHFEPSNIVTKGIKSITSTDIEDAEKIGGAVKLTAHYSADDNGCCIYVEPKIVMNTNPLSTIKDVFNGILLDTNGAGQLLFFGKGAGKLPTASAVLSDICEIAKNDYDSIVHREWKCADDGAMLCGDDEVCDFYVRVNGNSVPENAEIIAKRENSVSFVIKTITRNKLAEALKDYETASSFKILR